MPIRIRKGLDIPIEGQPEQVIHPAAPVERVAVLGPDFVGLKPTLHVTEGERVRRGQPLFTDRRNAALRCMSPTGGVVETIHRGARRALQSVVIRVEESASPDAEREFAHYSEQELPRLAAETVKRDLLESGLWTALRTRPYSKVPRSEADPPFALFVTAIDTNPLAPDPAIVIAERADDFSNGLIVLSRLAGGSLYVCRATGASIPVTAQPNIESVDFEGPHPAGLVGTHVHFLAPVGPERTVWHIGYQDVMDIGQLFTSGRWSAQRVVALAGPLVKRPRLLRTCLGASLGDLVRDELLPGEARIVSGSVLSGRRAADGLGFLGRYHNQVSVLEEGRAREFLGWITPGMGKYSARNIFVSSLRPRQRFALTTSQQGSARAMVPIGAYESVVPLDLLPTLLLRALLVRDTDTAQALGCLELDEEDLALCSFVCPSKYDFGPSLRQNLEQIERLG